MFKNLINRNPDQSPPVTSFKHNLYPNNKKPTSNLNLGISCLNEQTPRINAKPFSKVEKHLNQGLRPIYSPGESESRRSEPTDDLSQKFEQHFVLKNYRIKNLDL